MKRNTKFHQLKKQLTLKLDSKNMQSSFVWHLKAAYSKYQNEKREIATILSLKTKPIQNTLISYSLYFVALYGWESD